MSQNNSGDGGGADHTVTPFRDVNAETTQRRIADDLRHARVARGLEVADVARILRIRAVYLAALEEGRFAELPGPTYVAGFLRAYGRFLDLDGDELVRRYKDESGGVLVRQELNFPVPASEARHPTGAMIVGALIVALLVAAAWFLLKDRQWADLDLVPEVPEAMVRQAEEDPAATALEDPAATALEDTATSLVAQPETAALPLDELDDEAAADEMAGATPTGDDTEAEAEAEFEPAAPAAEEAADDTPVETVVEAEPAEDGTADAAGTVQDEDLAAVAQATDASAELALAEMAEDGYVPRVYGRTNAGSRVEIRALSETWIQVSGPNNEMLLTRVLLPGDIYHVPDRDDVVLDTGNAGGLELRVDDSLIPPLGEVGVVVRNVPLAPESLLAR